MPRNESARKSAEYDLIEQLNFENWIEANIRLVEFIASEPRRPTVVHSVEGFESGKALTKTLTRGVKFGVLVQYSRYRGRYSLTERAEKYLEEHHPKPS